MRSLALLYSGVVRLKPQAFFFVLMSCPFSLLLSHFINVLQGRNVDALIVYFGEDPARCSYEQGNGCLTKVNLVGLIW